jgi:hypothetical protein
VEGAPHVVRPHSRAVKEYLAILDDAAFGAPLAATTGDKPSVFPPRLKTN